MNNKVPPLTMSVVITKANGKPALLIRKKSQFCEKNIASIEEIVNALYYGENIFAKLSVQDKLQLRAKLLNAGFFLSGPLAKPRFKYDKNKLKL